MFESYWLLLLSIVCLLSFQFIRLKAAMQHKADATLDKPPVKPGKVKRK